MGLVPERRTDIPATGGGHSNTTTGKGSSPYLGVGCGQANMKSSLGGKMTLARGKKGWTWFEMRKGDKLVKRISQIFVDIPCVNRYIQHEKL